MPGFLSAVRSAICHARHCFQHLPDPVPGGKGLGHGNDQIGQLDQLHQDLGHIVDQGDDCPLCQDTSLHLQSSPPQQGDQSAIDQHIGDRIHQGGNPSHKTLQPVQLLIFPAKSFYLFLFSSKSPDHPGSGQRFPGQQEDMIQSTLYFPV